MTMSHHTVLFQVALTDSNNCSFVSLYDNVQVICIPEKHLKSINSFPSHRIFTNQRFLPNLELLLNLILF